MDDYSSGAAKNFIHRLGRETGKRVAAAAAPDLKRVTLKLGGNDAAIILADVNPAAVAQKYFLGRVQESSGHICSAIKRVYVPEQMYNALARQPRRDCQGRQGGRRARGRHPARSDQQQNAGRRMTELAEDQEARRQDCRAARASARKDTSSRRQSSETFPMACGWSMKSSSAGAPDHSL